MKTAIDVFDEYMTYLKGEIYNMKQTINTAAIKQEALICSLDKAEKTREIMLKCEDLK